MLLSQGRAWLRGLLTTIPTAVPAIVPEVVGEPGKMLD